MMTGKLEIKITVNAEESAQLYGEVLQNLADKVNEQKIKEFAELIRKKPNAFIELAKNLNILKNWL